MKVYVLVRRDYEETSFGPVCATRALAEKARESLKDDLWRVEEYGVLDELPARVTMHYVQRYRDGREATGTMEWWDYEVPTLPCASHIAWGTSEEEARARLKLVPCD